MAKVQIKSKADKAKAASGGGKSKKKKWSKGRSREKLVNAVLFDKKTYDRLMKEVPKMKLITPSAISERLKVNGSLARASLKHLLAENLIRQVAYHSAQQIYTRTTADATEA